MASVENVIAGLDIGTTKIGMVIGEVSEDGSINVLGVGQAHSEGLRKGVVVNIDKTVKAIEKARQEAELMAGIEIHSVVVGIAGGHIKSINSKGVVAITNQNNEIMQEDIDRVIEQAKAIAIPMDREIIHVLPQEFIVDEQTGIKEPVGMSGVRLEVEAHVVTGAITSAENIYKSVEKAGLEVTDLVLEPLASSYAVLTDDEKELGVALIDMGGGTTDIAIFFDDAIRHTAVVGLGGRNVTSDIAIGIRTPLEQAEEIKKKHGIALSSKVGKDEYFEAPGVGGRESREISRSILASIIEPRLEEIFSLVHREIKRSEFSEMLGAGIVITGGGALLEGMGELAEQVFDMPVRIGYPRGFGGLAESIKSPIWATGVGLIQYGLQHGTHLHNGSGKSKEGLKKIFGKIKQLFREYF
jgi:cell division protein FtsA